MTIYVLSGFNNYYNRVVKKFDTLSEYMPYELHTQENYNFVPNDNVNTQLVLGNVGNQYTGEGDYLLVTNEFNEIVSRWFIIESVRDRAGQFTLTLHRDLVADHYDEVSDAPMFIEKATLSLTDPLIYNMENMSFNQIKTSEKLLKDKTGCGWIVGYLDKDILPEELSVSVPMNEGFTGTLLDTPIENWSYYQHCDNNQTSTYFSGELTNCEYVLRAYYSQTLSGVQMYEWRNNYKSGSTTYSHKIDISKRGSNLIYEDPGYVDKALPQAYKEVGLEGFESLLQDNGVPYHTSAQTTEFLSLVGKTIQDTDGKIFKVSLSETVSLSSETAVSMGSNLFDKFVAVVNKANENHEAAGIDTMLLGGTANQHSFRVNSTTSGYKLHLEDVTQQQGLTLSFGTNRLKTEDAPWNIFAIPYGSLKVYQYPQSLIVETNEDIGMKTAMAISKQLKAYLYDIQLLPYCPIPNAIQNDGSIFMNNNNEFDVVKFTNSEDVEEFVSVVFHVPSSNFNSIVNHTVESAQTSIDKKVNNECDKWRLTSPNYSNYFDFSVEKNEGISYFDIDCTYKPFTPYIHINPNFKGLYGYDDNSPRGLVLGGDFSLNQITDQWLQYQAQNKNFQATFDRQIQNMELNNSIGRTQDIVGAIAGALGGAATGGISGGMMATGGKGSIWGAAIGGAASLGAGIADISFNEKLRNESLDYTKDMFGYQLGNIQALPNTISKVSAYNANNKIFPILEYYTCTDEEKKAFVNKLAWNGMTTMRIGTMNEFMGNSWSYDDITSKGYIKGKLIRLETVEDDYHIINELSNELNKGVYI